MNKESVKFKPNTTYSSLSRAMSGVIKSAAVMRGNHVTGIQKLIFHVDLRAKPALKPFQF